MSLLGAREAAKYLNISLATLYRIERGGKLTPFRTPGGHRRYNLAMLDEYLERSRQRNSPVTPSKGCAENTQGDRLPGSAVRILVVDDEPYTIEMMIKALREDSDAYEFTSASTSYEVGVQAVAFRPDLIVLGTLRSETDRTEVCERIKSHPETRHIKVVGIVDSGENGVIQDMLRSGADDCLIKPLQIEELQRSVRYLTAGETLGGFS
jgi:excisionase family DNA binding protein